MRIWFFIFAAGLAAFVRPLAAESAEPKDLRVLYVNTKDYENEEAGKRLNFAAFSSRAAMVGALNFNSIVLYQFHHFRDNAGLTAQLLDAMEFSADVIRARGEIPRGGAHVFPPLFASDAKYRDDLVRFFAEIRKRGMKPLAATGNTAWGDKAGRLVERPVALQQLKDIAAWCDQQGVELYVISDMSTTYDAKELKTKYADRDDDGGELRRVLDLADPTPRNLYREFFAKLAILRKDHPSLIGGGLEEFPLQGRFLQDDSAALPGFSDAAKALYAQWHPGASLPRYDSLGGEGNVLRMQFVEAAANRFFDNLLVGNSPFQVTHLHNYIANWRYKMAVPRGNYSGDPYVHEAWMLPSVVTFLQPTLLDADPKLAERYHLLLLHPRGRALNQWHLEKREPRFGTDRVAATWPFFMAGAAPPLVGYHDQLPKILPHFSGVLVLPYRITSDEEDRALADWVKRGNILVLGSFAAESADGRLDPKQPHLPLKWTTGRDALLAELGWKLPQTARDAVVEGPLQATWTDAFQASKPPGQDISLEDMAGRSLAIPRAPGQARTFCSLNGQPYIQGMPLGKGWVIWHNILPFANQAGELVARYDSQEGWYPLKTLPTQMLRAALSALKLPVHISDSSLVLGNGTQVMEVSTAKSLDAGALGCRLVEGGKTPELEVTWRGIKSRVQPLWEREFKRYWPREFPPGHFLAGIQKVEVEVGGERREGWSATVRDETIFLKAENPQSLLPTLYRLLEKAGWRWVAPGKDRFSARWMVRNSQDMAFSIRPALALRGMMTHTPLTEDSVRWIEWLPKGGYNFFLVPGPYWDQASESVKEALKDRLLVIEVGAHSFDYWYPHGKYFASAPETFALVKGTRKLPDNRWIDDLLADRQVATTHPAVPPAFAEAMDAFATKNPDVARLSLWPNDGFGWDESPEAKALDRDGMSSLHAGMPNLARRYLAFFQSVQRLRKTEAPATFIAYAATLEFPRGAEVEKGSAVYVAPYLENYAVSLVQATTGANARYWTEIKNWIAAGAEVTLFEYWLKYAWLSQPLPIVAQQKANIQAFAAAGGTGLLTQAELDGWDVNAPLYYAGGRLLVEPDAGATALIAEYFDAQAGPEAGALLTGFWQDLEKQLRSAGDLTAFGANLPKVFTPQIMERWDQLVRQLEALESPEAKEVVQLWKFRRDVALEILGMLVKSRTIASGGKPGDEPLKDYASLVDQYDRLLSSIRQGPFHQSFDPLLPKFLASNVLRPALRKIQKQGLVVPEELIRDKKAGTL